jgi:uncharacterized protein (DUF1501 family)
MKRRTIHARQRGDERPEADPFAFEEAALTRREILGAGALGLVTAAGLPLWSRAEGTAAVSPLDPLLVVIFLRGAADGLHLVPPMGDASLRRLRAGSLAVERTLALPEGVPGSGAFALHPAFEPIAPLLARGELAIVHAAGSPDPTRSHFEAQDFMEAGTPGRHARGDGWMARALGPTSDEALFSRIALTSELPISLRGTRAIALSDPQRLSLGRLPERERAALTAAYEGGDPADPVVAAGRRALEMAGRLRELEPGGAERRSRDAASGGRRDRSLKRRVETLIALDRSGGSIEAAFLDVGDWDTHSNQGGVEGRAAQRIRDLAEGMAALHDAFAGRRALTTLVMTEFGRTARPNGTGGTDHGHGSAMLVAGSRVRPGVHGEWRGLGSDALHQGRDLPVLNDYRDVAAEVLRAHLGRAPGPDVFPGHTVKRIGVLAG